MSDTSAIVELDSQAVRVKTACGGSARMVWRRWGSGPALVLLHGGAGSWLHWIRNIEQLARSRTVWVPDLPGFGDSDLPEGRVDADTIAPHVAAGLAEVLDGEPFDLAGFSFGGLVAALVAAERPPGLRRLVLVSVAGMGLIGGASIVLKPMRGVTDASERREITRHNLNSLMIHDPARIDALALEIQAAGAATERARNRTLVMTDILLTLPPRWQVQVFGIWGTQDALYRDQIGKLLEKTGLLGLQERFLLEDAGHWLQYECPDSFQSVLERCLAAAPATTIPLREALSK
jgi:2-hydroxy-6-oxonona-2,4-dienedioate hydrolase